MPWERHDNNIYDKVVHWFDVFKEVLDIPDVEPWNVGNMDETGIMLSMLGSVKVLVGKDDQRDYRGAGTKRTMVTAIECVSASGDPLNPMIIWPASTHSGSAAGGASCLNSGYGNCCSRYNYCGSTSDYCLISNGCQSNFGSCNAPSSNTPVSVSNNGRCGADYQQICLGSSFGNCCSQYGYCGTSNSFCGTGCQSGYGTCSSAAASSISTRVLSTPRASTPSVSSRTSSSTPTSSQAVSRNTRCGPSFGGQTCKRSSYGNCCSQYSYCGSTDAYCNAATCQKGFGDCNAASSLSSSTRLASRTSSSSLLSAGSSSTRSSSTILSSRTSSTVPSSSVSSSRTTSIPSSTTPSSHTSTSVSSISVSSRSSTASSSSSVVPSSISASSLSSASSSSSFEALSSSSTVSSQSSGSASSSLSSTAVPSSSSIASSSSTSLAVTPSSSSSTDSSTSTSSIIPSSSDISSSVSTASSTIVSSSAISSSISTTATPSANPFPVQIVVNPSFEIGTGTAATGWTVGGSESFDNANSGRVQISPNTGSFSFRSVGIPTIEDTSATLYYSFQVSQIVNILPSSTYRVQIFARVDSSETFCDFGVVLGQTTSVFSLQVPGTSYRMFTGTVTTSANPVRRPSLSVTATCTANEDAAIGGAPIFFDDFTMTLVV